MNETFFEKWCGPLITAATCFLIVVALNIKRCSSTPPPEPAEWIVSTGEVGSVSLDEALERLAISNTNIVIKDNYFESAGSGIFITNSPNPSNIVMVSNVFVEIPEYVKALVRCKLPDKCGLEIDLTSQIKGPLRMAWLELTERMFRHHGLEGVLVTRNDGKLTFERYTNRWQNPGK